MLSGPSPQRNILRSTTRGAPTEAQPGLRPEDHLDSGNSSFPAVGIDSNDDLHVIWCDQTPGPSDIYYKRSSDGGSTWTTSRRITWTSGSSEKSALAVDSSDALHVVWSDYQVGNPEIYYMRSTDGGSTWSVARRMTWTSGNSSRPAIAVDSSDTLHVVWNDWTLPARKSITGTAWTEERPGARSKG